jgi:multidrug efflux pump subunit AcrA (membrane-fusion protein)
MKQIIASHHVVFAGATAALVMSAALAGCSTRPAAAASADAAEPIAVTIAPVAMTDVVRAIDAGGVVQARTTATIASRILAPVREVRVSPGDQVRKGQTLIVLDGDDLAAGARAARSAALAAEQGAKAAAAEHLAAEAGLALARASHDRIGGLQAKRSATAQELDDATATLRSAEARVAGASARASQAELVVESARAASDQASTTGSFTTIAAPFDGLITEKMVEPGQARPYSAWRTHADSASRSAWMNHASARFETATTSRSSSEAEPSRSRARWLRSAGQWMPMRERFSSRSRCPMHAAFEPANSARRDLAGRPAAR